MAHRDIKPENIVLDYNLNRDRLIFRFIDFGGSTYNYRKLI